MSGLNNWAALIHQPINADAVEAAARKKCQTESHCSVYGWTDEANMASTLPMLDREASAMVFSYSVNRTTGYEKSLWNCQVVKRPNPDQCLAAPEPEKNSD
jgi:hypothetical protein